MRDDLHAEVAGGGIAGIAVAIMLRARGWSVRVHEQDDSIREIGAGIYLRPNSMSVLDVLGVASEIYERGIKLERSAYRDGVTGRVTQRFVRGSGSTMWICPREILLQALERKAREAGVDIEVDSRVLGAKEDGVLQTSKGDFPADLVVGADGVASAVRESLGLTKWHQRLPSVATRYLVPNRELELKPQTTMYWSGSRRVGISPCSETETYVYMISREDDAAGVALPMNVDSWTKAFPIIADSIRALRGLPAIQNNYRVVKCHAWQKGRAAIIGDAAHGLPPLLGQGAGLALSNANSLATSIEPQRETVPQQLQQWEKRFRPYADQTQWWSMHLDTLTNKWPKSLLFVRDAYLWAIGKCPAVQRRMRIADSFPIRQPQ